jgi:anion-transporting  ArsA/GET3 family ATPase
MNPVDTDNHRNQIPRTRIVVCVGPGGVGKTTTAAALGLACAEEGKRAVVITVDPAKRLADALGIEQLTNKPTPVALPRTISGSLHALMLDTAKTFDDLIDLHATDANQALRIRTNAFYKNISRSLSGTQEYMAMEKLYELVHMPTDDLGNSLELFDVVIVDTPPTKNGLDLVSASDRLIRLLDNRIFRALMASPGRGFGVVTAAAQLALKPLGRVVGSDVLSDAVSFFQTFEGMEAGFRARAVSARALLTGEHSRWVLVAGPQEATVREATELGEELSRRSIPICGVVANRVQPLVEPLPSVDTAPESLGPAIRRAEVANELARSQREVLAPLHAFSNAMLTIGLRNADVHTIAQLRHLAGYLRSQPVEVLSNSDNSDNSGTVFSVQTVLG